MKIASICPVFCESPNKSRDFHDIARLTAQRHRMPTARTATGMLRKKDRHRLEEVDFAERRIGSLRAEKAPPRLSGDTTQPSCPNFSDDSLRNSDAPGGASRVPAKSVGRHGKPRRPYAPTDTSAREATSKSPLEGLFTTHMWSMKRPAGQANGTPSHRKARSTPTKRPFEGLYKYHHWLSNRPPKDLFGRVTSDPEK